MAITAKIIEHSISAAGVELITMELEYPRFIHAEAKTHRVLSLGNSEYEFTQPHALMDDRDLSRNAASSRAIPVKKMLDQVRNNPVVPHHWGQNQKGMQAHQEVSPERREKAIHEWHRAAKHAAYFAESLNDLGIHKQIANRLLEPFQWMKTIVSATEWDNFFELRLHPDAEPHFQLLAGAMWRAAVDSQPIARPAGFTVDCWHLPYVLAEERETFAEHDGGGLLLAKVSAARCARVSYLTHDGRAPNLDEDLALYDRLAGSTPLHASPLEHQAFSLENRAPSGNLVGWLQHRKIIEQQVANATTQKEQTANA